VPDEDTPEGVKKYRDSCKFQFSIKDVVFKPKDYERLKFKQGLIESSYFLLKKNVSWWYFMIILDESEFFGFFAAWKRICSIWKR